MNNSTLKILGMKSKEVKLYLKLLEVGESGASSLSKRTDENRNSTYSTLLAMQKKGLVSFVKKRGVKYFIPTDPRILVEQYQYKANNLAKFLPELLAVTNNLSQKPKITFYEGISGIKQIGEITLEAPGSTRLSFMGIDKKTIHPEILDYYENDFINRRIEKEITYRGIVTGDLPMGNDHEKNEEGQLRELKYINGKKLPIKIHIDIFPNSKVALYSYRKDELMGVVIEHEAFYVTMKTVFELAWAGVNVLQ
jgi:HTH-type transcriptional regulator, sugar sensing transcriptional regulator